MAAPLNHSYNAENILTLLKCGIHSGPNTKAVSVVPCMHKFCQECAEAYFGSMATGSLQTQKPCPECRRPAQSYHPDFTIRQLAQQIFQLPNEVLAQIEEVLPENSAEIEEEKRDPLPFPGKGAKFVLSSGNWAYRDQGHLVVRSLTFVSVTPDSLFSEFSISGRRDGTVLFTVEIANSEDCLKTHDYFLSCGLSSDLLFPSIAFYQVEIPDALKKLFRLLVENNEIPATHLSLIRSLAQSGDWRTVTPVSPEEERTNSHRSHSPFFGSISGGH